MFFRCLDNRDGYNTRVGASATDVCLVQEALVHVCYQILVTLLLLV